MHHYGEVHPQLCLGHSPMAACIIIIVHYANCRCFVHACLLAALANDCFYYAHKHMMLLLSNEVMHHVCHSYIPASSSRLV